MSHPGSGSTDGTDYLRVIAHLPGSQVHTRGIYGGGGFSAKLCKTRERYYSQEFYLLDLIMMAVTVKIPPDLARRLNTLVDENLYPSQEAALKDAILFLVAMKGKLYNRSEIQEILSRYSSVPSENLLQDVKQEEEL